MKIEVLYIADCPNHRPVVDRMRHVLQGISQSGEVREVEVRTAAEAESLRFIGSPTVRVNGLDVEPEARTVRHFGMGCRSYLENGRRSGLPSVELLQRSIYEAMPASLRTATTYPDRIHPADSSPRENFGFLAAGGVAAVLASTCCFGPLLLVALGFSGAWIGNLAALEPYRPWFIAFALIALLVAGRRIFRKPESCAPGDICSLPTARRAYKVLFGVVAALVLVAVAFP